MTFWETQNYRNREQINDRHGLEGRGRVPCKATTQGNLGSDGTALCHKLWWQIHDDQIVKIHRTVYNKENFIEYKLTIKIC